MKTPLHDSSTLAIEVRGLKKSFGKIEAVRGLDLKIREGICFGLLGPNGAGKTTTIEMMEGILDPDEGEILVRGQPLSRLTRARSGIQFQATALPDYLKVGELLQLFHSFYEKAADLEVVIDACDLRGLLSRDAKKLSGGQKQRVMLALALVNDPDLVFLDEPTTGLDPQARRLFWDLVKHIKRQGKTILLTTHYMDEAYVLCDEIAVVDHGKVLVEGTPQALLSRYFGGVLIELPRSIKLPGEPKDFGWVVTEDENHSKIRTSKVHESLEWMLTQGIDVSGLRIRDMSLEDLFLELTGRELRA